MPDVYQGTELFEYSLVDPDNRRPVDWAVRRELLARLDDGWLPDVDAERRGEAAGHGERAAPAPVPARRCSPATGRCRAGGPAAEHAVAFQRSPALVAVATRLPVGLAAAGGWRDTVLPLPDGATDWWDVITGAPVERRAPRLADLLERYPVALLVRPA